MGVKTLIRILRGFAKDFIENRSLNSMDSDNGEQSFKPKAKELLDELLKNKELNEFQHYLIKQEINQQLENSGVYEWGTEEKNQGGQTPPKWQDIIRNQKKMYDKTIEKYFGLMVKPGEAGTYKDVLRKQAVIDFRHELTRPDVGASDSEKQEWIEKSSLIKAEKLIKNNETSEKLIEENLKQYKFTEAEIKEIKKEAYAK